MRTIASCIALVVGISRLAGPLVAAPPSASQPEASEQPTVVAVAPFPSDDAEGKWGEAVTRAFSLKLVRWPGTTPIDRFSYADLAGQEKVTIAWATPVADVVRFARETLQAEIIVYGDVRTRAEGREATLRVRAIDLRAGPVLAVDRTFEITYPTQLRPAVEIVLNQLVGYSTINMEVPALVKLTPAMEKRWTDGPNLVPNPDLDTGNPDGTLADWEIVLADKRYHPPRFEGATAPLSADYLRHGLWGNDPADAGNRVLHMPISEPVAATYGVACYSEWIPITPGCVYRFSYRWRVEGPTPKVFIKGYALRPTPGELEGRASSRPPGGGATTRPADRAMHWQRREVYRRQVHPTSDADPKRDLGGGWTETTADFCPRHDQAPPHWLRIDLYAYWPKGHAWFDRVVLKQLSEQPVVEQRDPEDLPRDVRLEGRQ